MQSDLPPEWMRCLTFEVGRYAFDVLITPDGTIFVEGLVLTDAEFEAATGEVEQWITDEDGQYYIDLEWIERGHPHYRFHCQMVRQFVVDHMAAAGAAGHA